MMRTMAVSIMGLATHLHGCLGRGMALHCTDSTDKAPSISQHPLQAVQPSLLLQHLLACLLLHHNGTMKLELSGELSRKLSREV